MASASEPSSAFALGCGQLAQAAPSSEELTARGVLLRRCCAVGPGPVDFQRLCGAAAQVGGSTASNFQGALPGVVATAAVVLAVASKRSRRRKCRCARQAATELPGDGAAGSRPEPRLDVGDEDEDDETEEDYIARMMKADKEFGNDEDDETEDEYRARMMKMDDESGSQLDEEDEDEDDDSTLYFGGVAVAEDDKPEDTEPMRVASRINEFLASRRAPAREVRPQLAETAWYEELGCSPTATQDEIQLQYLERARDVEDQLAYLLGAGEEDVDRQLAALESGEATVDDEDEYDSDEEDEEDDDAFDADDDDEDEDASYVEGEAGQHGDMIAVRQDAESLAEAVREGEDASEVESEAERVALEFMRISNLYQILSVPKLRKIYDEGGVEGLAERVPMLHKGLLEPEKVLRMAQGLNIPMEKNISLLLRRQPRTDTFARYQAKNSIKQVLRRMTDVFRVWCFKSGKSLKHREGTVYTELPEIGVFGRVNAGKSQMLQHLLSAGRMRRNRLASAAQWPGKTQGIDVFCVNRRFTLADSPGYGRKDSNPEIYEDWKTKHKPLVEEYLDTTPWMRAAIYCHDIGKDVKRCDIEMVEMLKKRGIPVLLVLTKDDKVDSDTHRTSRAKYIRKGLMWPRNWPHTYYTTRRGRYGQLFKNMMGTMMLGLMSTETREDAFVALKTELNDIYHDYRDKYVPRKRGQWGKLPKERKVRTYPNEDKAYTDEDLAREEDEQERAEKKRTREKQAESGYKRTLRDDIEEEAGVVLTPRERRKRWEEMLATAKS